MQTLAGSLVAESVADELVALDDMLAVLVNHLTQQQHLLFQLHDIGIGSGRFEPRTSSQQGKGERVSVYR